MRTNYMMTVDDVMEELGVKRSKAYSMRQRAKPISNRPGQRQWYCIDREMYS